MAYTTGQWAGGTQRPRTPGACGWLTLELLWACELVERSHGACCPSISDNGPWNIYLWLWHKERNLLYSLGHRRSQKRCTDYLEGIVKGRRRDSGGTPSGNALECADTALQHCPCWRRVLPNVRTGDLGWPDTHTADKGRPRAYCYRWHFNLCRHIYIT